MTRLNVTVFSLTKNNALYGLRLKNNNSIAPSTLPLPPHSQRKNRTTLFPTNLSKYQISPTKKPSNNTINTTPKFFYYPHPKKTVFLLVKNFSGLFRLSLCCPINATRFLINNNVLI
jgi:hypothetical protein